MNKKYDIKNYILGLLTVGFLVLLYFVFASDVFFADPRSATLIIKSKERRERTFRGHILDNMTLLETLFASTAGSNLKLSYYVDDNNDIKINSIGEEINGIGEHSWNFFLNRRQIRPEDINKIFVREGDIIEAKFN